MSAPNVTDANLADVRTNGLAAWSRVYDVSPGAASTKTKWRALRKNDLC